MGRACDKISPAAGDGGRCRRGTDVSTDGQRYSSDSNELNVLESAGRSVSDWPMPLKRRSPGATTQAGVGLGAAGLTCTPQPVSSTKSKSDSAARASRAIEPSFRTKTSAAGSGKAAPRQSALGTQGRKAPKHARHQGTQGTKARGAKAGLCQICDCLAGKPRSWSARTQDD
jgi:hypothetical protein